ncbi:MAG: DUF721 domain-containing protein [Acetobacteraceae bacterium]|nr:DUF721 domain-containing protein [Acetobacteraceae bacterium]
MAATSDGDSKGGAGRTSGRHQVGGEADRYLGGPRPLGAIVPRLTRPAFRRFSPAAAQILADWPEVVGPALAAVTVPRRLTRGTLTLACSGPVALELAHLAPQLIARINAHCGRVVVQRLSFVQKPPAPGATGTMGGVRAPGAAPAPVPPRVAQALGRVAGAELRAALEKLAQGVYRSNQQRGGDS